MKTWSQMSEEEQKAAKDWAACCRAAHRLADLTCAVAYPGNEKVRQTWPTATWAEIIACELGIEIPEEEE
jgi:hypothetical protein